VGREGSLNTQAEVSRVKRQRVRPKVQRCRSFRMKKVKNKRI
jgi:hypothetical protein